MDDTCKHCYFLTGKKGDGKYKCYCGDCPAKIRDDKDRNNKIAERIKRAEIKRLKRQIDAFQSRLGKIQNRRIKWHG